MIIQNLIKAIIKINQIRKNITTVKQPKPIRKIGLIQGD